MQQHHITLSQLNGLIREVLETNFMDEVWLIAEIAEMRIAGIGHCYLDLVERRNNKIVARMRANIWKFQYDKIAQNFFRITGTPLKKGMSVLMSVGVSFHEQYGISLVVKEIDAGYSLGDLERQKKEIIDRLSKEGLLQVNKALTLELVPKRIAVISSETAAGYGDFLNQLTGNVHGYLFDLKLFPATMQGDGLEQSIITALAHVKPDAFDAVVIIRGGGASLDLAGFDKYELAKTVALFPLPVITGIGHERDETIVDLVANEKLKTPTAVADFLLQKFADFEGYYQGLQEALVYFTREKIAKQRNKLQGLSHDVKTDTQKILELNKKRLLVLQTNLPTIAQRFLQSEKQGVKQKIYRVSHAKQHLFKHHHNCVNRLENSLKFGAKQNINKLKSQLALIDKTVQLVHPKNVLQRGYAMVKAGGKVITSVYDLKHSTEVNIELRDGTVKSKIIK